MNPVFKGLIWIFRPPRKISFTKEGWIFTLFTFPVGLAAINTGNNMLYLVLGMLLSIIAMNGILSESSIKHVILKANLPSSITAGKPFVGFAEITNCKRYFPSYLLRVSTLFATPLVSTQDATCLKLAPGETLKVRLESTLEKRGIYPFSGFKLATRFPFGLFDKSRELAEPGEVTVYPQALPILLTEHGQRPSILGDREQSVRGRGEDLYAFRDYQRDDDARHIHWKISAKVGHPIVQEYTATGKDKMVVFFDTRQKRSDEKSAKRFEDAVSTVAFLMERAFRENLEFALWTPENSFSPQAGSAHFHRIMSYLATIKNTSGSLPAKGYESMAREGRVYEISADAGVS